MQSVSIVKNCKLHGKERPFTKSEEAIVHLSNVIMILLLLYLKWKNLEVFGEVNFYRKKGLSLPRYHNKS